MTDSAAGAPDGLAGRVAVVTGGSGGIGQAVARRLAAAGVAVAVGYGQGREAAERMAAEITSAGGRGGVTVNALAPALVAGTGMLPGDPGELSRSVPVGRLGTPGEVADLAMAMLRNGYLTSQVVSVDGGLHPR